MTRLAKRLGAGMGFALLSFVSLTVGDQVRQWLCSHGIGCASGDACPIDVCAGDLRLYMLRAFIWLGPAVVFGGCAFVFSRRQRAPAAWLSLLTMLIVVHAFAVVAVS